MICCGAALVGEPPGTSSRDGTFVDLAVVPPAGPNRAAALFLGGVPRQDVVAEVGVFQVVVALLPLLLNGGGGRGVSRQTLAHVICGGGEQRRRGAVRLRTICGICSFVSEHERWQTH